MLARLLATVLGYEQPPLSYCANCAGHYPPSHFPCLPAAHHVSQLRHTAFTAPPSERMMPTVTPHPGGTMHRRTTTISAALATAAAALLLTACSTDTPRPSTASSPAAPSTAHSYDEHDCRAVLERNFDDDNVHDAHPEPECRHLTRDEYLDVVKVVLDGRTGEIYEDVSQRIIWDEAWEQTDPAQQELVCDRLWADGAKVVGREMTETGEDEAEQIEMAEYFLDEKC